MNDTSQPTMIKILFVCHGNICRSPMAEYIFKNLIKTEGLETNFEINSAATSREEIGNDIYPSAKDILRRHNIPFEKHSAKQITALDMEYYDHIIVMEEYNISNLKRLFPGNPLDKVELLMYYAGKSSDVSDPWYTGDFEKAYNDIKMGCEAIIQELMNML